MRLMLERIAAGQGRRILSPFGTGEGAPLKPFRRQRMDEVLGADYDPLVSFPSLVPPYHLSCSHLAYDNRFFHQMVPGAQFITLLRDPFERAVSHFYYHGGRDFDAWYLEHHGEPGLLFSSDNVRVNNYFTWWLGYDEQEDISPEALDQRYTLIGLQERFTETVAILRRLMNLPVEDFRFSFERISNWRSQTPSEETRQLFMARNRSDYELYTLARELFEEKLRDFGPTILEDVEFLDHHTLPRETR